MATHGNDVLPGGAGPDLIDGLDGADLIQGGGGADTLSGGGGADYIDGGTGDDVIYGFGAVDAADANSGAITATLIASGFDRPTNAVAAPGRPNELFVTEQHTGRILILDVNTGQTKPAPFLDIPDNQLSVGNEQGLLGLAFHPDYAANGKFYVNLTRADGDTEVWEYTRSANADVADVASKRLVLSFDQRNEAHNGGWLGFGPDGYLYITSGDGGDGGDPFNQAQNIDSLLGKILRIDVDGPDAYPADPTRNYAIPAGNPFVGVAGADEVWAYGLRNPWRMSFDSATGDAYIGDVGNNRTEEINYLRAGAAPGANFGWHVLEGNDVYDTTEPLNPAGPLTAPVITYSHVTGSYGGFSVTGGEVYRGPGGGQGLYVFADFFGNLWTTRMVDGKAVDWLNRLGQLQTDAGTVNFVSTFGVDGTGRLYTLGIDGEVHRLGFSEGAADAADEVHAGLGADQVWGGAGDDSLYGDDGDDALNGGVGNDNLIGGAGADSLTGGAGVDTAWYYNTPVGGRLVIDMLVAANGTGDGAGDTFSGIERIVATPGDDVIWGSDAGDVFAAGGGNDDMVGRGGGDLFDGGDGIDTVWYFNSPGRLVVDLLNPAAGTGEAFGDRFVSVERVIGTDSADGLWGTEGNDFLLGRDGNDDFVGRGGADAFDGGAGVDTVWYTQAAAAGSFLVIDAAMSGASTGEAAGDRFVSIERFVGTAGSEYFLGSGGSDAFSGVDGSDAMEGRAGADLLDGGAGNDRIAGGAGADTLVGGAGADAFVWFAAGEGGDSVVDFASGQDRLEFVGSAFGMSAGALGAGAFVKGAGAVATGSGPQFVFDTATNTLWFDDDGAGAHARVHIATFVTGTVNAGDILIV